MIDMDCVCVMLAADGQHIYMHAVNIRCLVKQYGSLRDCPDTVTAAVVELESVSMDEVHFSCCASYCLTCVQ